MCAFCVPIEVIWFGSETSLFPPCLSSGIWRRRCRRGSFSGPWARRVARRVSPLAGRSRSSARRGPRPATGLRSRHRHRTRRGSPSGVRGSLFERRHGLPVPGIVARARRKPGVAHPAQLLSDCRFRQRHAKPVPKPCRRVAASPAHRAVERRGRAALHYRRRGRALLLVQFVRRTRSLAVLQALRPSRLDRRPGRAIQRRQ